MRKPRKQLKIGDIVEFTTHKGLCYAQYTHQHSEPPKLGGLIRIIDGFFEERPEHQKLNELSKKRHRFSIFVPLRSFVRNGEAVIVDNFQIPRFAQNFPTFKKSINPHDPEAKWWLWDGESRWQAGVLSEKEKQMYPIELTSSYEALIHHIEEGTNYKGVDLC